MTEIERGGYSVMITFAGERRRLSAWAKLAGLEPCSLYARLFTFGWSLEDALLLPKDYAKRFPRAGTKRHSAIRWVEHEGELLPLKTACRRVGRSYQSASKLLREEGLSPQEAFEQAGRPRKPAKKVFVTFNGKRVPLAEACEALGLPFKGIRRRVVLCGWPPERAIAEPFPNDRGLARRLQKKQAKEAAA
jgi:hypothetical protein